MNTVTIVGNPRQTKQLARLVQSAQALADTLEHDIEIYSVPAITANYDIVSLHQPRTDDAPRRRITLANQGYRVIELDGIIRRQLAGETLHHPLT